MSKHRVIYLFSTECDPETLKFPVMVDGGMEDLSLDQIQRLRSQGYHLTEWKVQEDAD